MRRRELFFSSIVIALIVVSAAIPVRSQGSAAVQAEAAGKKLTAGRNVNMVSGMTLPNGDPWLQRQNEPSLTVSTFNTLHLLGGSNDYRTVDMPLENETLPGVQGPLAVAPDAWLGLCKSVDGGQSWASTLLPGFPQDSSAAGMASPLRFNPARRKGFTAAADPVVRSGPAGIFYYSGVAFNRTQIPGWINSAVFVARFVDRNDTEAGDPALYDPIKYVDTQVLASDNRVSVLFIDKPWISVDAPAAGASSVNIGGQMIPRHNVYIAYSTFLQVGKFKTSTIIFRRSTDCGKTWGTPLILSLGDLLVQGATIAIDPRDNGNIYVAWRRFDSLKQTSAIMVARSKTKGATFESAKLVATFPTAAGPFDQPSTAIDSAYGAGFRTNSYPTMAVDEKGIVYLAWAQRGKGQNGAARIMLATSSDGRTWSSASSIDNPMDKLGHQFMPSLAFAAGKLTMAWYDQRDDYCANNLGFGDWIIDNLPYRHTIDVRAAQADTANYPNLKWQTVQISRYHFTLEEDPDHGGQFKAFQSQWNPPNYPLFSTGKQPFQGDYLDVAPSPIFVRGTNGLWRFNTAVTDNPLFHVAWTDNRDVRPPSLGSSWTDYAAPKSKDNEAYESPGRPQCSGGQQPGMRNQNVYTAQLATGIATGSPTNTKSLDLDVPRAFAVFVKNNTTTMRSFRLTIDAQPPGGQASFLQFELLQYLDVTIAPYSAISRQVFVSSSNLKASVLVRIDEIDQPDGAILADGMKGSVLLNGDPTSIGVGGTEETHQPQIEAPHIRNWSANALAVNPEIDNEDIVNTDIVNPNIVNLDDVNPAVVNPNLVPPILFNPHIRNTDYITPSIVNPHIRNPHIRNESPGDVSVTDVEWPVKNVGNTASSFSFTLIAKEALPEGLYAQLIIYKVHYTPAVAGEVLQNGMAINGCELKQEPHHEILLNVVNPDLVNPHIRNPNLLNPHIRNASIENATFVLGPGEEAIVNLRVIESHEERKQMVKTMQLRGFELPVDIGSFVESVGAAVTAQSVDSSDAAQGIEQPKTDATLLVITTTALPPGKIGQAYPPAPYLPAEAQLMAAGGSGTYSWWVNPNDLPPGLVFNAMTGQIGGAPLRISGKTYPCVYSFTVQVSDTSSPQQTANQRFSIVIEDPYVPPPPLTITTPSPLPVGTEGKPYGTSLSAVGGTWPYTWTRTAGEIPPGLFMDDLGTIGGTPTLAGTYNFTVRVTDSNTTFTHSVEKGYSLTIREAEAVTYTISGVVTLGVGGPRLPDVLMIGLPSAPSTDGSGSYSDTVPAGWSGTAVPFKAGYYFVPAETSYTNVQSHRLNQNYVAYPVVLHHFDISPVGNATAGVPFPLTITAKDDRGEIATTYTDANILTDTTGTISPKMTGPFVRGGWTGQVTISKAATGVTIQTTGGGRSSQSNAFNVDIGVASAVRIDDAPGGTGSEVLTRTLGPGHMLTVFAVSHDLGGNYTGNVPVVWSLTAVSGGIVDGDLVPSPDGLSAVFTAHVAGTCRISAQNPTLGTDTTGTITVMEAQVDDPYEDNDDLAHAAPLPLGTHANLVLMDADWFKVTVPTADAGKDLMIHLKGISYPDPNVRHDLDMIVLDASGRMWGYNLSGGDDEYTFIPRAAAGDYFIGQEYIPIAGIVYSLTAEVGTDFGIGTIEGRVTGVTGEPVGNAIVELYGEPFNWDTSRPMTTTDANGDYRIGFFPGKYTVRFNIYNASTPQEPLVPDANYLGKTYNDNQVLTIVPGAAVPNIDAQLEPGGTITGRVTDAQGNGLNLAIVNVHAGVGTRVAAVFTDALGQYVADRIPSGNFKLRARQDARYGLEWYGAAPTLAAGLPVRVVAGQTTSGIDIDLEEDGGHVQGRVTDSLGNPIAGVTVSAFDEAGINVSAANTDEAGNYNIPRLMTGEVRIYFNPSNAAGNYYAKYFPNADLLSRATPIPVTAGETTANIDAQLSAGGTITGRVTDSASPANGVPGITVLAFDTNSDRYYATTTDAAGNYILAHILPDDYKVLFRPGTGSAAAEWYDNWNSSVGAKVIAVPPNQIVPDINAQLADLSGSISGMVAGVGPLEKVRVVAYDSSRGTPAAYISQTATSADGTYMLKRLPGADYKVYFDADASFLGYSSEYYVGKSSFAEANPITVPPNQNYPSIGTILMARPNLDITTTSLPDGRQGQLYSASLAATGGRPFYDWTIEYGTLPNGVTLDGNGEIRGIPMAAGTYTFTVKVTDSTRVHWFETQSDTQPFTMTVAAYTGAGYVVSGTVLAAGLPVSGVVMDGLPGAPATNASGQYSAAVASGWSGTVTPTLAGHSFNPSNRTYTNVTASQPGQDYAASAGWTISGTIRFNGAPLPGVLMLGLPGEPRTNTSGFYSGSAPAGWTGTVTPTSPGYAFTPPNRTYSNLAAGQTAQDFTATYSAGVDDTFENNDTYETAAVITVGTHTDLVLNDADWYKLFVPASDAGKILRIHVKGVSYPDPTYRHDLDFYVIGRNGKVVQYNISGGDDEFAFVPDLGEGWYAIGLAFLPGTGVVYSLSADIGTDFGIGFIEGRVTDEQGRGLEGIYVELYGQPFNWDNTRPMVFTDANGHYKVGFLPGEYTVLFNVQNFAHRDPLITDLNYVGKTSPGPFTLSPGSAFTGVDARLLQGGTISGHLADAAGNPLRGSVRILAGNGMSIAVGYVDANSNYVAERVPEGNYKVLFIPTNQGNYATEWYDGAGSLESAAPVPVTAGQTTADISFHVGPQGFIEGTVTDTSGTPLAGIGVTPFDVASPYMAMSGAMTDANGHYTVGHLQNGLVKLRFNAPNVALNYAAKFYPDAFFFPDAAAINVQAGQTVSGINVQLAAAGSINGRVTDSTGQGLYNVSVVCEDVETPRTYTATTAPDGYYTILDVMPDVYRIRFVAGYGNLAAMYFDGKEDATRADLVTVHAGETLGNINAQLTGEGGFMTGRLLGPGGAPIEGIAVTAVDRLSGGSISQVVTNPAGMFTVRGLPTSELKVNFNTDTNWLPYVTEFYSHKADFQTADPVATVRGQTLPLSDIVLGPMAGLAITTASLPNGALGVPYSALLQAAGGRPFYYFQLESGSLPHGLTLDGKGEIQGLPSALGTFDFTVKVTDSTRPRQSVSRAFSVTIGAYTGQGYVVSGRITAAGAVAVPGVVLSGLPGSPVTNAFGEYVGTVSAGWSGTVTPTLIGYAFDPPIRTYANVITALENQDFTATAGYSISGTITLNGTPLPGVLMAGLPGEPRTNSSGVYRSAVPSGWSGTVTPTIPGFSFNPPNRTYSGVTANQAAQDYAAVYAGGVDDRFEDNDSYETAAVITPGAYGDLVMGGDEDWFKVYVPASDAGKIMRVHVKGVSYPDPTGRYNLDFKIVNQTRKFLSRTVSGSDDETAFIPDLAEGWYFIGVPLTDRGLVYSLSVDIGADFGLGFIEGRVMDEQGNGIEGVYVELSGDPYDASVSRPLILTSADGTYRICWTPGNYRVSFNGYDWEHQDPWAPDVNYVGETYNPAPSLPIPLIAGSTIGGIDIRLAAGGTVTGRVTDAAGNGLSRVYIRIFDSMPLDWYGGHTNPDGSFSIDRIRTGNYKIQFMPRTSDLAKGIGLGWFDEGESFDEASPVHIQGGQTTPDINARLGVEPGGYIEGVVTNTAGQPIQGVAVQANDVAVIPNGFTRIFPVTLLSTTTDASGRYRLGPLPQSSVKLSFTPPTGQNLVIEYFPDKLLFQEAEPVMVLAGQTTYGIDAQLAEAGTFSGRVTDAAGNPLGNINIGAIDTDSDRYYVSTTNAAGNYTLSRLSPDDYKVICYPLRGNLAAEWFDDQGAYPQGSVVAVGAGQNVQGIDIRLEDNGAIITGQVRGGGVPLKNSMVIARDIVNGLRYFSFAYTDAAGNYILRGLPTGEVKLQFVTNWIYGISPYRTEYYNNKGAYEFADPIATVRGQTTSDINVVLDPYPALTISTTSPLPDGQLAVPYEIHLQALGGKPFYCWSLESGALANGLTLKGNGVISGVATATGTFNFTVRVVDATLTPQSYSQAFAITIGAYMGVGHLVSGRVMTAGAIPVSGVVLAGLPGSPVTNSFGEYAAAVPPGWSGTVSPSRGGYTFVPISRTYSNVTSSLAGEDYAANTGGTLAVSTGGLSTGRTGSSYSYQMVAQGGTPPYSWTVAIGRLPDGLTLNTSGQISGTPTEGGEFPWTVRVADSSSPQLFASRSFSLIINPAHGGNWTTTYPLGGQINTMGLVRDPLNPGMLYAVVRQRGIYRSTDGGASWTNFTETATAGSGTWFDARYLNVFVIGHDSQFYMAGNWGLFKSLNQGAYWTRIDAGFSGEIIAMALDPANGNRVYAGTREGKVYTSSDGGSSWADFSAGLPADEIHFLAVDPADPSKIYAGTGSTGIYRSAGGGAWVSINGVWAGDLGITHLGRVETIAFNPGAPGGTANILIVAHDSELGDGIYKTADGGATWSSVTPQVGFRWEPGYYIALDPTDPNVLYAVNGGSIRIYALGGSGYSDHYVAASNLSCLAVDPVTLVLYAGTDADGLFKSNDRGQTWTAVNSGIRAQSFPNFKAHTLHIDSSNPDIIYAGSISGGYRSLDGGDSWQKMNHPDGYNSAFATHPSIPGTVFSIGDRVYKSTTYGSSGSWTDPSGDTFHWFGDRDIVIVPSAPSVLYAGVYGPDSGTQGVWKSLDGGATWAPKNVGLTDTRINTLAIHPSLPNVLFAATRLNDPNQQGFNTRLFRTLDGGETWQQVTCGLPDTLGVTQIVFAPSDPNIMYLSAVGWNRGLYKSTDGGGCWVKLNSANAPTVAVHPANPDIVYVGTFGSPGFYVSFSGGQSWTQFNSGLHPNPWVDSIALDPRNPFHVFLGTNAGVYETTLNVDMVITTTALPNAIVNQSYSAGLNAAGGNPPYAWSLPSPGSLPFGIAIETTTGTLSGLPTSAGSYALEVKVADSNGRSFTKSFTLNVLAMYPLATNSIPPNGGTVTRTPDQFLYTQGAIVELKAVPNTGYTFIGWSGDISGTKSTELVVMMEGKSIQANFALTSALPDYYVPSASFPAAASAGDMISGSVNIAIGNQGAGTVNPPAISAGIYLSNDALVTPEDILLWKGQVLFAPPGSMETIALPINPGLQIPTTIAAGTYTIGILIDDTNAVVEGNESNNSSTRTITISSTGYDHLELLSGWPYGTTTGVDADGSRHVALRAHGGVLEIVNISDPSHPSVISRLNLGPNAINTIKIVGSLAYVGGRRFSVVDISDLRNPQVLGSCAVQSTIRDFDISGSHAYVSDYHYGLRVIDISTTSAPAVVGFLPLPDCRTRLVKAFGNTVYVTRHTHVSRPYGVGGLSIVDASNAANPVERSFLNLAVGDLAIDKTGHYLFVYTNSDLKIYDVSNPALPVEAASYGGPYSVGGIKIVDDRAYLTDGNQNRVFILDISDPVHPVEISTFQFLDATSLARPGAAGNLCLVPSWYDSLRIVDFSNLSSPTLLSSLESVGIMYYADVANGHAYVSTIRNTTNKLKVLNLANLSNITETASLETFYSIDDVVANGIRAYLVNSGSGLHVVDVSDPAHPFEEAPPLSAPQAQDIVISGDYAYVANGNNGLKIFDIRTPAKPGLLGACPTPGYAYQLAVSGRYAYLACDTQGLRIIDISDPRNPHIVGSHVFSESAYNVGVWGNYAYVVNTSNDILWIVDVSDPANPVERGMRNVYYCFGDIGFSGDYMFVPNTFFGLRVYDISDPANPVEVAIDRRFGSSCEVIVRENLIYIVDRDSGFYVVEFRGP